MASVMVGAWFNYIADRLDPAAFVVKGQSPGIVVPLLAFPLVVALWLLYQRSTPRDPWISLIFLFLILAWIVHIWLSFLNGDQLAHTTWLYLPLLIMLLLKPPDPESAFVVVQLFAWVAVVILVGTRVLEMFSVVPVFQLDEDIIQWEKERYWIPLSDFLGIEGRWPGPFGFNSKTGFIGALIVTIALVRWRPRNLILMFVGIVTLLVTASRGSFVAAACGLGVLATFTRVGPLSRIPVVVRASGAVVGVLAVGMLLLASSTGLTGRGSWIWPAFVDLWQTSPWTGVGQVGILADPAAGVPMEAHNLYLQELTRFGVVGLVVQYTPVLIGLFLALVAALRGRGWPLSLLIAFGVASITEVFMDGWLLPSTYILLLILAITATRPSKLETVAFTTPS
jgi:O-antigen ligase